MVDLLLTFIGFMTTCFAVSSTLPYTMKTITTKKSDDVINQVHSYHDHRSLIMDDIWNWDRRYCFELG